jgi:hypothetical protein
MGARRVKSFILMPVQRSKIVLSVLPALVAAGLALAACGPREQAVAPDVPASAGPEGFLAPPSIESARRTGAELVLTGTAPTGAAAVRLTSPEGLSLVAQAGADGRWALSLPTPSEPLMFAVAADVGGRQVPAQGPLILLPAPGPPAMMARAGFAALPIGAPAGVPAVAALDYDAGGGAAVAGFARPDTRVRLSLDGAAAGISQADEAGRFAVIAANRPLSPGRRRLQVETETGEADVDVDVSRPEPLGSLAYRAERQADGWRIDWAPAGGGVQTTVVFDRKAAPAAGPAS